MYCNKIARNTMYQKGDCDSTVLQCYVQKIQAKFGFKMLINKLTGKILLSTVSLKNTCAYSDPRKHM